MIGYIYLITNTINDKKYVGQTRQTVEERWKEHKNDVKRRKTPLYRAMKKYGIDKFNIYTLEKIEVNIDICGFDSFQERLDQCECAWIKHYDSYNNGYNLTLGGQGIGREFRDYKKLYKEYLLSSYSFNQFCHINKMDAGNFKEKLESQNIIVPEPVKTVKRYGEKELAQIAKLYLSEYEKREIAISQFRKEYGYHDRTIKKALTLMGYNYRNFAKEPGTINVTEEITMSNIEEYLLSNYTMEFYCKDNKLIYNAFVSKLKELDVYQLAKRHDKLVSVTRSYNYQRLSKRIDFYKMHKIEGRDFFSALLMYKKDNINDAELEELITEQEKLLKELYIAVQEKTMRNKKCRGLKIRNKNLIYDSILFCADNLSEIMEVMKKVDAFWSEI